MKTHSSKIRSIAIGVATLVIFGLAIYALKLMLREVDPSDVVEQLGRVSWLRIFLAAVFTAGSYFMLTFFDYFAVRSVARRLPYSRTVAAALTAYGIGHSAGVPSLSGGSVRYRYYTPEGLSALEIAAVVTLVSLNFLLGLCVVLGVALVADAHMASRIVPLSAGELHAIGVALLAFVGAFVALTYIKRSPIRILGKQIPMPTPKLALAQIFVSCCDLFFSAAALYILLPNGLGVGFPVFVGVYVIAIQAGVLSNVPAGLGVFESVLLLLLPGVATDEMLGALVLYRLIYYVLPFIVGVILFMHREAVYRDGQIKRLMRWIRRR